MIVKREFDAVYVTRYMGAKYKLLNFIVPVIEQLLKPNDTLLDIMAGTHAVGYSLKKRNRILANDIQFYSEIFGRALIKNNSVLNLRGRYLNDFRNLTPSNYLNSWFVKTYTDTYFSQKQCTEIVAIRDRINQVEDENARCLYLTVLSNAMSLCQSSSGHFAQYFPKDHPRLLSLRAMSVIQEFEKRCRDLELIASQFANNIFRMEVSVLLKSEEAKQLAPKGSLVYFDPPYSSAQYSRYYHLLETVFLNDSPEVNFKGLYRGDRFQSDFCSSRLVGGSFENVIQETANNEWNLVISYSDAGLLDLSDLVDMCKFRYRNVKLIKKEYGHSTQGRGIVSRINEVVIACSGLL